MFFQKKKKHILLLIIYVIFSFVFAEVASLSASPSSTMTQRTLLLLVEVLLVAEGTIQALELLREAYP